jgi:NnrS protein
MNIAADEVATPRTPTFLTQGFRPFFLAAGFWSAAAIALWVGILSAGIELPTRFDPLTWHIHEMLFGFVMAVIAGFILTAIPNWTQQVPVSGFSLATLAGLWLLGRIACLISAFVPPWLAIIADLSFSALLIAVTAREIIAAGNWRNLPVLAPVTLTWRSRSPDASGGQWRRRTARPRMASRFCRRDRADLSSCWSPRAELYAKLAGATPQYASPGGARLDRSRRPWHPACRFVGLGAISGLSPVRPALGS